MKLSKIFKQIIFLVFLTYSLSLKTRKIHKQIELNNINKTTVIKNLINNIDAFKQNISIFQTSINQINTNSTIIKPENNITIKTFSNITNNTTLLNSSIVNNIVLEEKFNKTQRLNQNLAKNLMAMKKFEKKLENKINILKNLQKEQKAHDKLEAELEKVKEKENFTKHKQIDPLAMDFYHNLSLIMLSMLAGGLVGVMFILYFSFRKDEEALI